MRISTAFSRENVSNAIDFADGSFVNLGQITDSGTGDGISMLTLTDNHDANIRYVRITHFLQDGADLLVTVNQKNA